MRLISCFFIVIFLAASLTHAQKFVQPKKNNVGLYANESRGVNENAIKTVGVDDRLKVLKTKRNHFQVQMDDGTRGWIEKRLCATTRVNADPPLPAVRTTNCPVPGEESK